VIVVASHCDHVDGTSDDGCILLACVNIAFLGTISRLPPTQLCCIIQYILQLCCIYYTEHKSSLHKAVFFVFIGRCCGTCSWQNCVLSRSASVIIDTKTFKPLQGVNYDIITIY
jgi:hypothetical protein